jgi:hypothetical protein
MLKLWNPLHRKEQKNTILKYLGNSKQIGTVRTSVQKPRDQDCACQHLLHDILIASSAHKGEGKHKYISAAVA